jgi:TfoX/Sxy family transcriptional regulator of competence genes
MADERWQDLVEQSVRGDVTQGTMFGSKGLRTGKKYFAVWWHEQLVTKLPPDRLQELVSSGRAEPFEPMAGRPMNGWVIVDPSTDWPSLVEEAREYVESQNR